MTMDADEFYIEEEFREAKRFIFDNKITHSYCSLINYSKKADVANFKLPDCSIQFFCEIRRNSKCCSNPKGIAICDPTRYISLLKKNKQFYLTILRMYHMSAIRKDLYSKLLCSSGRTRTEEEIKELIKNIDKAENLVKTKDIFNLNEIIKSWNKN